jgi:DNA-binding CsgD family transcriptional regulator
MQDPCFTHSHLLRSCHLLVPHFYDPTHIKQLRDHFHLDNVFLIIQRYETCLEGSIFATKVSCKTHPAVFMNNTDLLYKFTSYFRKEARVPIGRMLAEGFNTLQITEKKVLGNNPSSPLLTKDPKIQQFLKTIQPLSQREQQCFQLYKEGKSAQTTGAILGLSQRTVESYFENIKNKLGCSTKAALLEW